MHPVKSLLRAGLLLTAAGPSSVLACSFTSHEPHVIDDTRVDEVAPGAPSLVELSVTRGHAPIEMQRGVYMTSSCGDLGWVTLWLSAEDDLSAPENLGFVFTLESGEAPFTWPTEPIRPAEDGILFIWVDEATDEQEPIEATLSVNTVDEAGNVSDEALLLTISDEGGEAEVKRCTSASSAPGLGLLSLGLLGITRRRARRQA